MFPSFIPAIPMMRILRQYAYCNKMPFDMRWENIVRVWIHYNKNIQKLN